MPRSIVTKYSFLHWLISDVLLSRDLVSVASESRRATVPPWSEAGRPRVGPATGPELLRPSVVPLRVRLSRRSDSLCAAGGYD